MHVAERTAVRALAEARQAVYRFLKEGLDYPEARAHGWLAGPEFRRGLELLCDRFGLACPEGELFPPDLADSQSRYLACFEVGLPAPPVPPLASHYNRKEPVPATVHEHVLFYKRFGARLAEGNREPPDHLRNELAFLAHLDDLLLEGMEEESLRRARHDFLARQVGRWVGRAAARAQAVGLPAVYRCLLELLARAVAEDLEWSREATSSSRPRQAGQRGEDAEARPLMTTSRTPQSDSWHDHKVPSAGRSAGTRAV
jgi:DMSO reductase family type II enzyme chaperone